MPLSFERLSKPPKKEPRMNPVPLIVIANQSNRLNDDACTAIAHAMGIQLARDVSPVHGFTPALEFNPAFREITQAQWDYENDGMPCFIIDEPDVTGALGYHDTDDNGNPYMKIFVNPVLNNGGTPVSGSNSVSSVISHEILETVGDADANWWADGPQGFDYAIELCDACESDCYDIEGVSVSDFLFRSFFQPKFQRKSGVRYDQMRLVTGPLSMRPGGYMIQRTESGRVTDIFANMRGAVQIDHGICITYGREFPAWKRPYKMKKAIKHAEHNYLRHHGKKVPKAGT
jgi:hypothetical protein